MIPDSDIKWASTCASALAPETKFTIEDNTFWSWEFKISTQVSAAFNQKTPTVLFNLKK